MIELTILITTYNRKERLKEMLHSIDIQGCSGEYKLIISDNHSDYNVEEFVLSEFGEKFTKHIKFNSWRFNTGQSTNMSISFLLADTKWYWYLSDDDELVDGSLRKVLDDIKVKKDVCAIKYSIQDTFFHNDIRVRNINDFIKYYNKKNQGEMIFLSMVYNLDVLRPYLGDLTKYSYTYISFLIPVLRCLISEDGDLYLSSSVAYKYKNNSEGWSGNPESYLKVLLGIRTFFDIDLNLSKEIGAKLINTVCFLLETRNVVNLLIRIEEKYKREKYYRLLKPYMVGGFIHKLIFSCVYKLYNYFGVNVFVLKKKVLK